MPPSARIPTVEFRSLLLPPIRVSLRAFQLLCRPRCSPHYPATARSPQGLAQCRALTLYKAAKAATTLGQHKVLPFDLYKVASPGDSAHEVTLVREGKKSKDPEVVAQDISLEELYEKHIGPGKMLYMIEQIDKKTAEKVDKLKSEGWQLKRRTYGILHAGSMPGSHKDPTAGKGAGALRTTPLSLSSPTAYFKLCMDRSYQYIEHGAPVEFSIAIKRSKLKKEERHFGVRDRDAWPWLHENFPHLRPDFILKSMPEGSRWSVEPVSDGRVVQFVIIRPSKLNKDPTNYTKRLFNVKRSVKLKIERGEQAQLPMIMRQRLFDAGVDNYSPLSSMPVKQPRPMGLDEKAVEPHPLAELMKEQALELGEEDKDRSLPTDKRYMPDASPPEKKPWLRLNKMGGLSNAKAFLMKRQATEEARRAQMYEVQKDQDSEHLHHDAAARYHTAEGRGEAYESSDAEDKNDTFGRQSSHLTRLTARSSRRPLGPNGLLRFEEGRSSRDGSAGFRQSESSSERPTREPQVSDDEGIRFTETSFGIRQPGSSRDDPAGDEQGKDDEGSGFGLRSRQDQDEDSNGLSYPPGGGRVRGNNNPSQWTARGKRHGR